MSAASQTIGPLIDFKDVVAQVLTLIPGSVRAGTAAIATTLLTQTSKAQKLRNGNQAFLVPSLALAAHTSCPVNLSCNTDGNAFWPRLLHVNWSVTLAHNISP